MTRPALTIVIPSHRAALLHEAMGSVFNQTRKDIQLLVSYTEAPYVAWWPEKINELAAAAKGENIAILCDDDVIFPTFAEETLAQIEAGADVAYTHYGRWTPNTTKGDGPDPTSLDHFSLWPSEPWELTSFQSGGCNPLCGATFVMKRELWRDVGGVDPAQLFWDWALAYACFKAGAKGVQVPKPLVLLRVHPDHDGVDNGEAMRLLHQKYPELKRAA